MKKVLLLSIALGLFIISVNAQSLIAPPQELQMAKFHGVIKKSPKKATYNYVYYDRPAGAFVGTLTTDGNLLPKARMVLKPNSDYTFHGVGEGTFFNSPMDWSYYDQTEGDYIDIENSNNLTVNYSSGTICNAPYIYAQNEDFSYSNYQLNADLYVGMEETSNLLLSSKTMIQGGRFGNVPYIFTYYSGLEPYGNNDSGWWFGKNGGLNGRHVDGVAQAFEKPEHAYIIKQVVLMVGQLKVAEQVEMTCKIYKIADGIPAYQDEVSVTLPEEPGELIATGRAELAAMQGGASNLIDFTLYDNVGNVITPIIDDAILIVVDGYNEPEMAGLTDFSVFVSSDDHTDEGFGELAYIKYGTDEEDGSFFGDYTWTGLNKFFQNNGSGLEMKAGFSIFITTEFPDEEVEVTDAPIITWTATDGLLIVTATGNGNVVLNVGNESANGEGSATIAIEYDIFEGIEVVATAYAQENGKLVSETVEEIIEVPANPLSVLNEPNNVKSIATIRYFNTMGQEMNKIDGTTIVLVVYSDSSIKSFKVIE